MDFRLILSNILASFCQNDIAAVSVDKLEAISRARRIAAFVSRNSLWSSPADCSYDPAQYRDSLADHADTGTNEATAPASNVVRSEKITTALFRPAHEVASRAVGKWLIAPLPNPNARTRLFCFPYAGGGLASFRDWTQRFKPFSTLPWL
jgi:hypothetical protein